MNLYNSIILLMLCLLRRIAADSCTLYTGVHNRASNEFCTEQACQQYCSLSSDVSACMREVYISGYELCTETPCPYTPCDEWYGKSKAYDEYCQKTACPKCSSGTDDWNKRCVEAQLPYCSIGTLPPPLTECDKWTGKTDIYNEYCHDIACQRCIIGLPEWIDMCTASQREYCTIN